MSARPAAPGHALMRERLSRFVAVSVALHLILMAGLALSPPLVSRHHPGQAILDVQLPGESVPATRLPAGAVVVRPAAKITGAEAVHTELASEAIPVARPDMETRAPIAAADESRQGLRNQLLGVLKTRLSHYLTYPPVARRQGWEGTVWLGLRVQSDGQLDGIRLERSSGHAVLDDSALNSLRRVGNLAEAGGWLEGRSLDMQLPVIYRLIEN